MLAAMDRLPLVALLFSYLSVDDELILGCFDSLLHLDDVSEVWHGDRWCATPPRDGEVAVSEDATDQTVADPHGLNSLKPEVSCFAGDESMFEYDPLIGHSELVTPATEPGEWEHHKFDWVNVFDFGESESCDRLLPGNVCFFNIAHSFGLLVCWFLVCW